MLMPVHPVRAYAFLALFTAAAVTGKSERHDEGYECAAKHQSQNESPYHHGPPNSIRYTDNTL
jgi:hypothetical protein